MSKYKKLYVSSKQLPYHAFFNPEGHKYYKTFFSIYSQPNGNLIIATDITQIITKITQSFGTYMGTVNPT